MRRALATAAAAAVLLPAGGAGSAGAQCTPRVAWDATRYKLVATRERVPIDRRLGRGVVIRCGIARPTQVVPRVSVYAVRGVRPSVAIAVRPSKPVLYVSTATPTAAERRVLDRLRAR
jgi:uncharacterized protein DUF6281